MWSPSERKAVREIAHGSSRRELRLSKPCRRRCPDPTHEEPAGGLVRLEGPSAQRASHASADTWPKEPQAAAMADGQFPSEFRDLVISSFPGLRACGSAITKSQNR